MSEKAALRISIMPFANYPRNTNTADTGYGVAMEGLSTIPGENQSPGKLIIAETFKPLHTRF